METPAAASNLRAHDAPDGAPPPWGTQRRTRHRRMTTVSSTSGGFCRRRRRRRRRRRGCQAAGRGTIFGDGCAAQRAASAPSPPHLHSTRAHSAPSIRAAGTSWPDLGVRAQLLRSARASRRAAKGARRSIANGEILGSSSARRRAWSRPQQGRRTRASRVGKKRLDARIKGGPSQYPERLLRSPFSGSPGLI